MKVRELIEILSALDQEATVKVMDFVEANGPFDVTEIAQYPVNPEEQWVELR